jgi:hypothetical protein
MQIRRAGQRHVLDDRNMLEPLNQQGLPAQVVTAAERPPHIPIHVETGMRPQVEPRGIEHHAPEITEQARPGCRTGNSGTR